MKKIFGVAALLALLSGGLAASASAQCGTGVMIDFDADAFAYETNYNPLTLISAPGSQLSIVGHVALFCAPLAALDPSDPTKEYTFYVTYLESQGTQVFGPFGGTTFYETDYTGGWWEIFEGSPEDAPVDGTMPPLPSPLVPATFTNGIPILSGPLWNFHTSVTTSGGNANGSFRADYRATGGTFIGAVGDAQAVFQGNWCPKQTAPVCAPATYSAHPDGKWDAPPSTAVTTSTWGSIKKLYR